MEFVTWLFCRLGRHLWTYYLSADRWWLYDDEVQQIPMAEGMHIRRECYWCGVTAPVDRTVVIEERSGISAYAFGPEYV